MAQNMDDLAGLVGEVLCETRPFEDSWQIPGFKITGVVLRGDHPDWRQHVLDLQASRPEAQRTRRVVNERIFQGLAPRGFRQSKKLSEAEAHDRMLGKVAESERLQIDIFSLREQKEGIAAILCRDLKVNGESVVTRGGASHDLSTPPGRLSFFSHALWEIEDDGKKELVVPVYRKDAAGALVLDDTGEPIKNDLGGWNLGDAVAQLVVQEADNLVAFVATRKADALERSEDISTGTSASGTRSPSVSGGS